MCYSVRLSRLIAVFHYAFVEKVVLELGCGGDLTNE